MGLMMWMMRGKKGAPMQGVQGQAGDVPANQPSPVLNPDERLANLRAQLDDVEGQITRLAAESGSPEAHDDHAAASSVIRRSTDDARVRQ